MVLLRSPRRYPAAGRRCDAGGPLELWLVDLAACWAALDAVEHDTARLGEVERVRIATIRDPLVRRERAAAHTALRLLIERAAGPSVRGTPLVRGPAGKPQLADGQIQFSLSHTPGYALVGVSTALPIGVDLERTRPLRMTPHRREALLAVGTALAAEPLPGLPAEGAVVQAWVRLEAFSKARAVTLARTMADLGLHGAGHRRLSSSELERAARRLACRTGLTVCDLLLPADLQGAAAVPAGVRPPPPSILPAEREALEALLGRRR